MILIHQFDDTTKVINTDNLEDKIRVSLSLSRSHSLPFTSCDDHQRRIELNKFINIFSLNLFLRLFVSLCVSLLQHVSLF